MRIIHCPKLDDVMRTQSDEALVKLFEKTSNKLKQPDPEELSRNDFMDPRQHPAGSKVKVVLPAHSDPSNWQSMYRGT